MERTERYILALRFGVLTPIYDSLFRWVFQEEAIRHYLIELASIQPSMCLLDLGYSTATSIILAKQLYPEVDVVGIDDDPDVLAIARAQAMHSGKTSASIMAWPINCLTQIAHSIRFYPARCFTI